LSSGVPQTYVAGRMVSDVAEKKCRLHRQGHSNPRRFSCTTIFRNVVNHAPNHTASHPRTPESSATLLRHPRTSHIYVRHRTSWKRPTELLQKHEGRTYLPFRPSKRLSTLRFTSQPTYQLCNYAATNCSAFIYNSHHHTPTRLSKPTLCQSSVDISAGP